MKEQEIYQRALEAWGYSDQAMMAMGECGELIAELNRLFNQGRGSAEKVIDEIADVEIMLGQLKIIFGGKKVAHRKAQKLVRLESILDGAVKHPHLKSK